MLFLRRGPLIVLLFPFISPYFILFPLIFSYWPLIDLKNWSLISSYFLLLTSYRPLIPLIDFVLTSYSLLIHLLLNSYWPYWPLIDLSKPETSVTWRFHDCVPKPHAECSNRTSQMTRSPAATGTSTDPAALPKTGLSKSVNFWISGPCAFGNKSCKALYFRWLPGITPVGDVI